MGTWSAAVVLPEEATSVTMASNTATGGNTWISPPTGVPYKNPPLPIQTPFPSPPYGSGVFGVLEEIETDDCADGHCIDAKTIRTVIEDGEDEITGRCFFCDVLVYLPELEGALAFEKAGKAVGRAMTLEDGDDDIGELLADVNRIERGLKAEMKKYQRALGMLEIARDLVEQRACA